MKVRFNIEYRTNWGESLAVVVGDRKYPMEWGDGGRWSVSVEGLSEADLADYTYVVLRDGLIVRPEWAHHSRRGKDAAGTDSTESSSPAGGKTTRKRAAATLIAEDAWIDCPIPGGRFPRRHDAAKFDEPGFRGAGTAIPVFALRSPDDFGIGEFRDLIPLVDWAAATGQSVIQLLPVTDTTRCGLWEDSYPYSPVSSFALNPLYISLSALSEADLETSGDGSVRPNPSLREAYDRTATIREELNSLPEIDYPRVFEAKTALMREIFAIRGEADLASPEFQAFRRENAFWLNEYAEFCARRDSGTLPSGSTGSQAAPASYYAWVQFWADRQFSEVAAYARGKGISLKGDLPIGVSGDSADAYWHPELFNLDSSTGAPPDFFSADGQNWGFPTYNWEAMAADDYRWWKMRLRHMSRWFDAFRIDHILGFFRIWEIPREFASGRYGHFNPALPYSPADIAAAGIPLDAGGAPSGNRAGDFGAVGSARPPRGLFLPDPRNPGMFQPAIVPDFDGEGPSTDSSAAPSTAASGGVALSDGQRQAFWRLHDDFYFRRNDEFWRRNAMRKLPELLGSTGMLACGEDLGMVPDCVAGVMDHEGILSLEMPGFDKGRPWPDRAVVATSSHDMETLRMKFARENPAGPSAAAGSGTGCGSAAGLGPDCGSAAGLSAAAGTGTGCGGSDGPSAAAGRDPSAAEVNAILRGTLSAAPMLAIFPLQDWVALDESFRRPDFSAERINEPADPHHHWRFRIHFNISDLLSRTELNTEITSLLRESRRWRQD